MRIPAVSNAPRASCNFPVLPSTEMSLGAGAPSSTSRTGGMANGRAANPTSAPGRDVATSPRLAKATPVHPA